MAVAAAVSMVNRANPVRVRDVIRILRIGHYGAGFTAFGDDRPPLRTAASSFNACDGINEHDAGTYVVIASRAAPAAMPRILVIDDDISVRTTVRVLLERAGYEILEAGDGKEAGRMLDGVDLVITDLLMPEVDGVDLLGLIRREGHKVPVIAMSGGGKVDSKSYLEVARALGAFATIAKPFDLDHLLDTVRDALASRGA